MTVSGELMEWLSQNWVWLALGIGAIFMMRRGGGCCGSHGGDEQLKTGKPGAGEASAPHRHA